MARGFLHVSLITGLVVIGAALPSKAAQSADCPKECAEQSRFGPIPLPERLALIALYKSTKGDHWTRHDGWLGPRGTECSWYGVTCGTTDAPTNVLFLALSENHLDGTIPPELGNLSELAWLSLGENHLTGTIPASFGHLKKLEMLDLSRNELTGLMPEALIQRWLNNALDITAEAHLLTDVSEIDYESSASSLLCGRSRFILRNDGGVMSYSVRCRNATPSDRSTYCEVKQGKLNWGEFAELGWLIERNGFFGFDPRYSRNISDAGFENTRVTRGGKSHAVSSYAEAGPLELWGIERAIWGVADSVDWEKTTTQSECPRWQ